jgi:hypothetical protein
LVGLTVAAGLQGLATLSQRGRDQALQCFGVSEKQQWGARMWGCLMGNGVSFVVLTMDSCLLM